MLHIFLLFLSYCYHHYSGPHQHKLILLISLITLILSFLQTIISMIERSSPNTNSNTSFNNTYSRTLNGPCGLQDKIYTPKSDIQTPLYSLMPPRRSYKGTRWHLQCSQDSSIIATLKFKTRAQWLWTFYPWTPERKLDIGWFYLVLLQLCLLLECTNAHISYMQTNMVNHYWISSDDSLSVNVRPFAHPAMNLQTRDSKGAEQEEQQANIRENTKYILTLVGQCVWLEAPEKKNVNGGK